MIDRLQEILPHLAHLPLEAQEEAAIYIEALLEALESEAFASGRARSILREGESIAHGKTLLEHGAICQIRSSMTLTSFDTPALQHFNFLSLSI